jgi:hypothetical protein
MYCCSISVATYRISTIVLHDPVLLHFKQLIYNDNFSFIPSSAVAIRVGLARTAGLVIGLAACAWRRGEKGMIRYTCLREELPTVEAALAANGYAIEAPLTKRANGLSLVVMTNGDAGVLLFDNTGHDLAEIEIWGTAQSPTTMLLESLPLGLEKQSRNAPAAR